MQLYKSVCLFYCRSALLLAFRRHNLRHNRQQRPGARAQAVDLGARRLVARHEHRIRALELVPALTAHTRGSSLCGGCASRRRNSRHSLRVRWCRTSARRALNRLCGSSKPVAHVVLRSKRRWNWSFGILGFKSVFEMGLVGFW